MERDLTKGSITKNLIYFTMPLILGNVFQQLYNIVDTFVVGKYIGSQALAAVGSSYTLMVFLTSIFIGLCMGASGVFAIYYGKNDQNGLRKSIDVSFYFIAIIAVIINITVYAGLNWIIEIFKVPKQINMPMKAYLKIIFAGMVFIFIYNFFANLLRSIGNTLVPLIILAISALLNIGLDLYFVINVKMDIRGVAWATVISQIVAAVLIVVYIHIKMPHLMIRLFNINFDKKIFRQIKSMSLITCIQQSVMNFGILLVQGLVNSFGITVMAAFAAAVKIDTLAYSPVQDFGNGFSTFIGQNYGAGKEDRIKKGIKISFTMVLIFSICISFIVCVFSKNLMSVFVSSLDIEVINIGMEYLRIEGSFYLGIGILFMLYGFYRAIMMPHMSLILTIISLGTRVILAYTLSSIKVIGVCGIWISVPIGWFLADLYGIVYYRRKIWTK